MKVNSDLSRSVKKIHSSLSLLLKFLQSLSFQLIAFTSSAFSLQPVT